MWGEERLIKPQPSSSSSFKSSRTKTCKKGTIHYRWHGVLVPKILYMGLSCYMGGWVGSRLFPREGGVESGSKCAKESRRIHETFFLKRGFFSARKVIETTCRVAHFLIIFVHLRNIMASPSWCPLTSTKKPQLSVASPPSSSIIIIIWLGG